jgi:hypothetical protein
MLASTFVRRVRKLLPLAALAVLCAGCGREGPKLHPVKGKVLFDGQPAVGATVVLRPIAEKAPADLFPSGVVSADGSFSLECYQVGRGAPEGEYIAVCMSNKLPERYSDETTSGLPVTVKPGHNELSPFELTR